MGFDKESIIVSEDNEDKKRLASLNKYDIEDFSEDLEMSDLAKLIGNICGTSIAMVNFLDDKNLIPIGLFGIAPGIKRFDKNISFCRYTILEEDVFEVRDTLNDPRFVNNPFVTGVPHTRFYAGFPLIAPNGNKIGALCVLDQVPKTLNDEQKNALKFLSNVVILTLELKTKKLELEKEKQKIEISEKKYRQLFELSQGLIGEHDMNGIIISANLASARSLEISISDLIGKNMRETLSPDTRDLFDQYLDTIEKDGYAEGIMHVKTTTGKSRYWAYKNVKVEDNGYPFVLCSSQDVTTIIEMEKQLRYASKIAQQSIEAKQQFLAKVTHEIRTPMNAIVGFGKLLAKTNLKDKQLKYVNAINTSGDNLLLIVNDLLDTSKIEAGKMSFENIPFSLTKVMSDVITVLNYKAAEKEIVLSTTIDKDVPENIIGDPTRLNQVLINLAGNAVKFTERGKVEILIKKEWATIKDVMLNIEVRDTGIGISEDKLPNIFESFTQANNDTSRKYGGTGLGLTIAKQIIELQNGSISVKSKQGHGTSFSVLLSYPIANSDIIVKEELEEELIITQKLNNVKILLAEDNPLNHLLLESIMEDWGVQLFVAENGKRALELLEQNNYDLVLMDVHMPEMDGYEASQYIRKKFPEPLSKIPIIAITANSSNDDYAKCIASGMNDFIPKPFRADELYKKISLYTTLKKEPTLTPIKKVMKKVSESKKRVIRLGYLKGIASGNKVFLKDVMDIFITQIPEELLNIEAELNSKNWEKVADTAHKMKLGINVMGMKDSERIILFIEDEAREKKFPDEISIRTKLEKLKEKCLIAVEEVKELMIEWKL